MNKTLISITLCTLLLPVFGCSEKNEESAKGDEVKKLSFTYETVPMHAPNCDEVKGRVIEHGQPFPTDKDGFVYSCLNDKLVEGYTMKDGSAEGLYVSYYESGVLQSKFNMGFFGPDGEATFYYENGVVQSEGEFTIGNKRGIWNEFSDNGKLESEQNYYTDSIVVTTYHTNNKVASIQRFLNRENPVKHRKSHFYDLNGELSEVREYWKGELERAEVFNISLAD